MAVPPLVDAHDQLAVLGQVDGVPPSSSAPPGSSARTLTRAWRSRRRNSSRHRRRRVGAARESPQERRQQVRPDRRPRRTRRASRCPLATVDRADVDSRFRSRRTEWSPSTNSAEDTGELSRSRALVTTRSLGHLASTRSGTTPRRRRPGPAAPSARTAAADRLATAASAPDAHEQASRPPSSSQVRSRRPRPAV